MDYISKQVTSTTITPSAGSDAFATVPAGEVWEVEWATAELVTDSTVTNRNMALVPFINSANLRSRYNSFVQGASQTVYYSFAPDLPNDASPFMNSLSQSFPKLSFGPGDVLRTAVAGLQTGDQVTLVVSYVKKPSN